MQFQDTFKVTGNIVLRRYDENGILNLEREHKNLVVTTGKELIASRLASDTRPAITITATSGTGTEATITYSTQTVIPYEVGTYVTISGVGGLGSKEGYNGTFRVKTATTTQITVDNTYTGAMGNAGIINSLSNDTIKTMRIGENNTVANLGDIALGNERGSVNLFSSQFSNANGTADVVYVALFLPGNGTSTAGLAEAALMNSSNKMLCRTVFPLVTKAAGESLAIFWTVTIN
jgi:hypothetical protein